MPFALRDHKPQISPEIPSQRHRQYLRALQRGQPTHHRQQKPSIVNFPYRDPWQHESVCPKAYVLWPRGPRRIQVLRKPRNQDRRMASPWPQWPRFHAKNEACQCNVKIFNWGKICKFLSIQIGKNPRSSEKRAETWPEVKPPRGGFRAVLGKKSA